MKNSNVASMKLHNK